jgi:hypothetical protein
MELYRYGKSDRQELGWVVLGRNDVVQAKKLTGCMTHAFNFFKII